jgi:hypothetical protein
MTKTNWIVMFTMLGIGCAAPITAYCFTTSHNKLYFSTTNYGDKYGKSVASVSERLSHINKISEALAITKPVMTDSFGEDSSGTYNFVGWSSKNMSWNDVSVKKNETSFGKAMKDIDSERTKKLCFTGRVIQISKVNSGIYHGIISASYWGRAIYNFYAVGNTGNIVEGNQVRFCGVVTGIYNYNNSGGGVSHAITVVGKFDLKYEYEY